jgi:hypothetical protein
MKILSIDIGITNLAFCCFEKQREHEPFKIVKWNVVNLMETDAQVVRCSCSNKKNSCKQVAKFKKNEINYCEKHAKQQPYIIPTKEHSASSIQKQTISKLQEMANTYNIPYSMNITKCDLTRLLTDYIQTNSFDLLHCKKKHAGQLHLFEIGKLLKQTLNHLFSDIQDIDYVIIENQIGPLAIRMKAIQGMVVQYFLMSHITVHHIEFISASNKLKEYQPLNSKSKLSYSERKKLSISICDDFLKKDERFCEHYDFFQQHKKKDDLADTFLQGLWFISKHNF